MRRGAYAPKNALDAVGFFLALLLLRGIKTRDETKCASFILPPSLRPRRPPPHMNDAAVSLELPPNSVFFRRVKSNIKFTTLKTKKFLLMALEHTREANCQAEKSGNLSNSAS